MFSGMQANMIISEFSPTSALLLADFGAAVDLRNGFNFNPEEGLLDPRYAPPELYVVPKDVPRAPPAVMALLASPALWAMHRPDRFDTYAVGMMMLQVLFGLLCIPYRLMLASSALYLYLLCRHDYAAGAPSRAVHMHLVGVAVVCVCVCVCFYLQYWRDACLLHADVYCCPLYVS